jgi:hypothetical protein
MQMMDRSWMMFSWVSFTRQPGLQKKPMFGEVSMSKNSRLRALV